MRLEAILVVGQENLAAHKVQEVPEVVDLVDHKERQDHLRKYTLAEMDFLCSLLLRCQV